MATVVGGNQVKLSNGQVIQAQTGGWYDGQQFWNGTLSNPGEFNSQNNQAGQQGQAAVAAPDQTFINTQRQQQNLTPFTFANPTSGGVLVGQAASTMAPGASPAGLFSAGGGAPTIDLNSIYQKALDAATMGAQPKIDAAQSEADLVQKRINDKRQALATTEAGINDNPYYGEATRTGRIAKLRQATQSDIENDVNELGQANNKVAMAKNDLATAKADAQVKLNIASQQYNIQSQQYQQNLQLFNSLLAGGGLDGATGADLAQIATATGMPTSVLASLVDQSKKSREAKPQLMTVSDTSGQYVVALDSKGNQVSRTKVGGPTATTSSTASTATNQNAPTQKLFDKYDTQISSILKQTDTMNQGGDAKKADKKLAPWEVKEAISRTAQLLGVNDQTAADLVAKGMNGFGYAVWTG